MFEGGKKRIAEKEQLQSVCYGETAECLQSSLVIKQGQILSGLAHNLRRVLVVR